MLEDDYYRIVSNPTRRRILQVLVEGEKSFSDLMRSVSMDPEHDTGPFLFHIHRLEVDGLIVGGNGRYALAEDGVRISDSISSTRKTIESMKARKMKGLDIDLDAFEPRIDDGWINIAKNISIKREEDTGLTMDPPLPEPGTMEVRLPTGRSKTITPWGKDRWTDQCLEVTLWGAEKCWIRLVKRYGTSYIGLEKHLKSGRVHVSPDGYFLDNWLKTWTIPRTSQGKTRLYAVKDESWSVQGEEETPEAVVYDPPKDQNQVYPLSRESLCWGIKGESHGVMREIRCGYTGEYIVRIGRTEKRVLGSLAIITLRRNGKVLSMRLAQQYGGHGLLCARYGPSWRHEKWGNKRWKESPKLTVEDEDFYMSDEDYIARTIRYGSSHL